MNALTQEERDALVLGHIGLAKALALEAMKRGAGVELDDLIGTGQLALVQAALHFDPTRGVKFSTYATHVVRRALWAADNKEKDWLKRRAAEEPPDTAGPSPEGAANAKLDVALLAKRAWRAVKDPVDGAIIALLMTGSLDGATLRPLAKVLGISHEAVRKRISRLFVRLREELERG